MAVAALKHALFFRGRMRWQRPVPAKGGRSKSGLQKKRACAAWGKSLAK